MILTANAKSKRKRASVFGVRPMPVQTDCGWLIRALSKNWGSMSLTVEQIFAAGWIPLSYNYISVSVGILRNDQANHIKSKFRGSNERLNVSETWELLF